MKKSGGSRVAYDRWESDKLSLRAETVRILTARELILAVAGNCLNGSLESQNAGPNLNGSC